ncbi:helix-turn-helix transcriptional regulator [Sphingomicrobium nitratireducens]|uniref:helix-turn-helix transcriptional regulator n=1 Tax=Sphingomicrobium nitratireducens TaxID=2964666 RepID=UPI00224099C1|nr:helix-turn-helix transcriptional regulator [Sphingomicrobium nitratireducens]
MALDGNLDWIYDAAFDDEALARMANRLLAATDSQFLLAGWVDSQGVYQPLVSANHRDDVLMSYFEDFADKDPWFAAEMPKAPLERTTRLSDEVPNALFARSELYNEFLRPSGLDVMHAASVGAANADGMGAMIFQRCRGRGDRDFSDEDMATIAGMSGAVRHVLKVRARLRRSEQNEGAFSLVSSRARIGAILLGEKGRIIQANALAENLLASGDIVSALRGRIVGADALGSWMAEAIRRATDATAPSASATISDVSRMGAASLTIIPVRGVSERRAMLMISLRAELMPGHDVAMMQAFGLTAGEAAVVRLIANGASAAEVAVRRGRSLQTVRVQIRNAMFKMHCARQTELIELARSLVLFVDSTGSAPFEL